MTSPLTLIEILEELEKKATAGKWKRQESILYAENGDETVLLAETGIGHAREDEAKANQELILEIRNNAPLLLSLARFAISSKEALEALDKECDCHGHSYLRERIRDSVKPSLKAFPTI